MLYWDCGNWNYVVLVNWFNSFEVILSVMIVLDEIIDVMGVICVILGSYKWFDYMDMGN